MQRNFRCCSVLRSQSRQTIRSLFTAFSACSSPLWACHCWRGQITIAADDMTMLVVITIYGFLGTFLITVFVSLALFYANLYVFLFIKGLFCSSDYSNFLYSIHVLVPRELIMRGSSILVFRLVFLDSGKCVQIGTQSNYTSFNMKQGFPLGVRECLGYKK